MHLPLVAICLAVLGSSALLSALSHQPSIPAWVTGLTLGVTGLAWMALAHRLRLGEVSLALAVGVGLVMRLMYFGSEPILEIDFFRYLWDGAAVNAGINPFAVSPDEAMSGRAGADWTALVAQSGGVADAISYGKLATIYPPVAQAAFWLAYQIDPWGITGLRIVFLAAELAGIGLLALLLKQLGHAPSWIAIYWWNPLVAKEIINSAHMDALLLPALAGALLLAVKARPILAGVALAFAAGVKIWPLVLAPILIWQDRARVWISAGIVLVGVTALIAVPMVLGRLDNQSGLVAYAGWWERNHALFGAVREGLAFSLYKADMLHIDPNRLVRLIIGFVLGVTAIILG
jgi:hypothetical protein